MKNKHYRLFVMTAALGLAHSLACEENTPVGPDGSTGGSANSGGSGGSGTTGGTANTGGTPSSGGSAGNKCDGKITVATGSDPMIDDMEHSGAKTLPAVDGRKGDWYVSADTSAGAEQLPPVAAPAPTAGEGREGSAGFLTSAEGFTGEWGAKFGVTLNNTFGVCGYDATFYDGISFWIRSTDGSDQTITVALEMPDVIPVMFGGTCEAKCYDSHKTAIDVSGTEWQQVVLAWSDFKQDGWGTPVPFDAGDITQISFGVGTDPGAYHLAIDDLAFEEGPIGAGGAGGGAP